MHVTRPTRWLPAGCRAPGLILLLASLLGGCALAPPRGSAGSASRPSTDGPGANPPADLAAVPDAEPRLEPIRTGGPNKPYVVFGRSYVPMTQDQPYAERGLASWYGRKFQGLPTSSGEPYDMYAMTAAHPTVPIPSYLRVRNPANGREVLVRVNDRGPFHAGRVIDLSYTAAFKLDLLRGVAPVDVERITFDGIRTGSWRRDGLDDATRLARAASVPTAPPTVAVAREPSLAVAPPVADVLVAEAPAAEPRAADTPAADTPAADAPGARALGAAPRGFWVQLGAFRERDGADTFQRRVASELGWLTPLLAVFDDAALYRLQAGPYPNRDMARDAAESIRAALQLVPLVVERR